jgi:uncharacterized protein (TIGR02145 family)
MKYIFYTILLITVLTIHISAQVQVNEGWNLIGATTTIQASEVTTNPPGIIISSFYGFNSSYYVANTLEMGKGYWVKVSSNGTIYGFEPIFVCGETPINHGYKWYHTVQIGTQCWFKENLDIGTMVPTIPNGQQNNGVIEKFCYGDNETNCQLYGGWYQWNEAMEYDTTEGARGICPPGWHIPTLADFQTLKATVNDDGNALKAVGQGSGAGAGTNTSGFSGLLAGRCQIGPIGLGTNAFIWLSTYMDPLEQTGYALELFDNNNNIFLYYGAYWNFGYSVRCLKD